METMTNKNQNNFRIAIIGAGIHAETNIFPSLGNHLLADVDKVAVCDLDEGKAKRMAGLCGCANTYVDYQEMIEQEKPDGVIICLNAKLHADVVINCLQMGVHVLVEKAPAVTVEEAQQMLATSQSTGKIVMVAHQKRHGTAYKKAREIVTNSNDFGKIVQIEAKMHGMPRFPTNFSCLMEWQIHNIDLLRSFGGDIDSLSVMSTIYGKNTAALGLLIKFDNGTVGVVGWGTYGGPGPNCERLEIISDRGKGVIVENAYDVVYYDGSWERRWRPDWNPCLDNQSQILMGYVGEIVHFIESAQNNTTLGASIEDGVKNLATLYEIARQMGIETDWQFTASRF